jgi:hypothetical protein
MAVGGVEDIKHLGLTEAESLYPYSLASNNFPAA